MNAERMAKLQEFLANDPNDSFTRYAVAMEYAGQGDVVRAITALEGLLKINEAYIPAYHQLGILYMRVNRVNEARDVLCRGIFLARSQNDPHAAEEMQEALDELNEE